MQEHPLARAAAHEHRRYRTHTCLLAPPLICTPHRPTAKPPEPQPKQQGGQGEKKDEPGEMAEKHKGEEGQMGKKDAPKTNARSAPKAIDPNAKEEALPEILRANCSKERLISVSVVNASARVIARWSAK